MKKQLSKVFIKKKKKKKKKKKRLGRMNVDQCIDFLHVSLSHAFTYIVNWERMNKLGKRALVRLVRPQLNETL